MVRFVVIVFLVVLALPLQGQSRLDETLLALELALETLVEGQTLLVEGLSELEEAQSEVLLGLQESERGLSETQKGLISSELRLTGLENTVTLLEADQQRDQFWRWIERGAFVAAIVAILIWK